eukprot:Nk52_evm15s136 gene=Nk52_evmTU15s136
MRRSPRKRAEVAKEKAAPERSVSKSPTKRASPLRGVAKNRPSKESKAESENLSAADWVKKSREAASTKSKSSAGQKRAGGGSQGGNNGAGKKRRRKGGAEEEEGGGLGALEGAEVVHGMEELESGAILTLKDASVLDGVDDAEGEKEETGLVQLENINLVEKKKREKRLKAGVAGKGAGAGKGGGVYDPYDDMEFDEFGGDVGPRSILAKYDDDEEGNGGKGSSSFVLGAGGGVKRGGGERRGGGHEEEEGDDIESLTVKEKIEREMRKKKGGSVRGAAKVSLMKTADVTRVSDFYTEEELKKAEEEEDVVFGFRKSKKKKKKKEKKKRMKGGDTEMINVDIAGTKKKQQRRGRFGDSDSGSDGSDDGGRSEGGVDMVERFQLIDKEEEEAQRELERALDKARKKNKSAKDSRVNLMGPGSSASLAAAVVKEEKDREAAMKMDVDENATAPYSLGSGGDTSDLTFSSTLEFVRAIKVEPKEEKLNDEGDRALNGGDNIKMKQEPGQDDLRDVKMEDSEVQHISETKVKTEDVSHAVNSKPKVKSKWIAVKTEEAPSLESDKEKKGSGAIFEEEEKFASGGLAAALALCKSKGYIEKAKKRKQDSSVFDQAPSYLLSGNAKVESTSIMDKYGSDRNSGSGGGGRYRERGNDRDRDRDRGGRRNRETAEERERKYNPKMDYKPNVKLEYVDEHGKQLNQKEAFRELSHKFHGMKSGKTKSEKRMQKYEEELARQQIMSGERTVSSLALLQERQKQEGSAFMVLSGSKGANPPPLRLDKQYPGDERKKSE